MDKAQLYDGIEQELLEWLAVGIESMRDVMADAHENKEEHKLSPIIQRMKAVYQDNQSIVVVDDQNGLHMFRVRLERV